MLLFQLCALALGLRPALICGAVLSILIPPTVAGEAAFPALSMQAPLLVTDWPAPSLRDRLIAPDRVGREQRHRAHLPTRSFVMYVDDEPNASLRGTP